MRSAATVINNQRVRLRCLAYNNEHDGKPSYLFGQVFHHLIQRDDIKPCPPYYVCAVKMSEIAF